MCRFCRVCFNQGDQVTNTVRERAGFVVLQLFRDSDFDRLSVIRLFQRGTSIRSTAMVTTPDPKREKEFANLPGNGRGHRLRSQGQ